MNDATKRRLKIGAAVLGVILLFILVRLGDRGHSSKGPQRHPHVAQDNAGTVPGADAANTQAATDPDAVERYPNIESPDTVAPGEIFAVQVSLTTDQISTETQIQSGSQHDGKLRVQLDPGAEAAKLEVILSVSGTEPADAASNSQIITLPREGDSTIAMFHLRAKPIDGIRKDTQVFATLWHDHAFVGRIRRTLVISQQSAAASRPAAALPPVAKMAETAGDSATQIPLNLTTLVEPADLTIYESSSVDTIHLLLVSRLYNPVQADIPQPQALRALIDNRYEELGRHGRGSIAEGDARKGFDRQHSADFAAGFGNDLYDKFAPAAFKALYWKIVDAHKGSGMLRVQVLSDDPSIPWELMRPAREGGSGRQDFLGLQSVVTRWHLSSQGRQRPPQTMTMRGVAAIAPQYEGARDLPAVTQELANLQKIHGYQLVKGDYADVRTLAANLPQGIVHFAGHGSVTEKSGVPQFAILLQDGQLEPPTWSALPTGGKEAHPLFFFNACEVGEAKRFMNEVDGWAPTLLDAGASGYIGALWSVNDEVATAFSRHFYDLLQQSLATGSADVPMILTKARALTYGESSDPTALAYVMYSDPALKMVP